MLRLSTNRQAGLSTVMMILVGATFTAAQDPERQTATAPGANAPDVQQSVARQVREAEQRIRRALQHEVTLEFKNEPLQEALRELTRESGVPLWIDEMALENEGITIDARVSADLAGVSVETALERILSRLELTWHIEHEVLKVTTETEEKERLSTEVYDVRELLRLAEEAERELSGVDLAADGVTTPVQFDDAAASGYLHPPRDFDESTIGAERPGHWLIDLLFEMTSGEWELTDGIGGSVQLLNGTLVVRQAQRVHGEIAGLLEALTRAAKGELAHGSATVHPPGSAPEKIDALYQALAKKGNATFEDETLLSALNSLGRQFEVPVIVDIVAFSEEGIPNDLRVSLDARDITLRSMLSLLLEPLGLAATVRLGALEITSKMEAAEHFIAAVYDTRDLSQFGIGREKLVALVQDTTSGEWAEIDGAGGQAAVPLAGVLVVRNTSHVQEEIQLLLSNLRRTLHRGEQNGSTPTKKPRGPDEVTTQLYRIELQAPIEQVADAINMFVAGELEDNAGALTITRVGATLMIRTTNRAHAVIRRCLQLLREAEIDAHSADAGGVDGPDDRRSEEHAASDGAASGGGFFSPEP